MRVEPLRDDAGRIAGCLGLGVDVTARRAMERALREEESWRRSVAANASAVLFAIDRDGVFRFAEGRGLAALGRRPEEIVGRSIDDLYRDLPAALDTTRRALAGEEFTATVAIGGRAFETHHSALRDAGGAVERIIGVATDVTARVAAEAAVRASEALFRAIFAAVPVGVARVGLDGRLLETNPAAQAILGYSGDELRGMRFSDYTHPDDLAEGRRLFRELAAGRMPGDRYEREKRYRRKDGAIVWGRTVSSLLRGPDGAPQFVVGTLEDLTARQEAEAARQRLAAIAGIVSAGTPAPPAEARAATPARRGGGVADDLPHDLTDGDRRLLDLIGRGWENAEIAEALAVEGQTVRNRCHDLYGKIGVESRNKAIVWAIQHGFGGDRPE